MTRFDLDMDGSMEPSEHGRWVRYEDAQRIWVGLTDEEIKQMGLSNYIKVVRETEAKLMEKNT